MKKMKRISAVLLLAAGFALAFGGCSNTKDETGTEQDGGAGSGGETGGTGGTENPGDSGSSGDNTGGNSGTTGSDGNDASGGQTGGGTTGTGGEQTGGSGDTSGSGSGNNSGDSGTSSGGQESKKEYLSLENLDSGSTNGKSTYDSNTKTITFIGEWADRGWWFGEKDASDYTKVTVAFTNTDNMGYLNLVVEYAEGNDTNSEKKFDANGSDFTLTVELDAEKKSSIKQVYVQGGQTKGQTATIKEAYFE